MEQQALRSNRLVNALRWLVFLPAGMLAGNVAWYVVTTLSRISMGHYGADEAGLFMMLAGSASQGAAFVYAGTRVAPGHHPFVPWLMCAVNACFFGAVALPLLRASRWMDLISATVMVVAAFLMALALSRGERSA